MEVVFVILVGAVIAIFVGVGIGAVIRMIRKQQKVEDARRKAMLDALASSTLSSTKSIVQHKNKEADMSKRLKSILDLHTDSDEVPGYCKIDDELWPCLTAVMAGATVEDRKVTD